jgi:hypothetical protein
MVVVAKPLEIIEGRHFQIGTGQCRGKFLANRVQNTNTAFLSDAFGKQFLCSQSAFLRGRLVACDARVHWAFFVGADVEELSSVWSVNHDRGLRLRAFRLLHRFPVLPVVENVRSLFPRLPRGCVCYAQRFLARRFEWFHTNLHEGFDFCAVADAVGANGLLPDFGKEKWIVSGAFRAFRAASGSRKQSLILRVKGCVGQVEVNFLLDPLAKLADGDCLRFSVFDNGRRTLVIGETLLQGAALVTGLKPRDFKRMCYGQFAHVKCLLDFLDKVRQTQPCIDIFLGAPDFLGKGFDGIGVGLQLHQGRIAPRFVEFVHVGTLQVFDELQFEAFRVRQFADARRNGFPFRKFRSTEAPRSRDQFVGFWFAVRHRTMNRVLRLVFTIALVGAVGCGLICIFSRKEEMENLRKLFGEEWFTREFLGPVPEHFLGKWYQKSKDNPVTRYADKLVGYALQRTSLQCDVPRLATKLQGEFVDTLVELGYAVFLVDQVAEVLMEPTAPLAGPDLRVVRGEAKYFVEIRRVQLDEAHASGDLAAEDVFERLCSTPSRHSVVISMTDRYGAFSPELKRAVHRVRMMLGDLEKRGIAKATLYYYGLEEFGVREGDEAEAPYDYLDAQRLAEQIRDEEWKRDATFVARFDDTGVRNERTAVGVLSLGEARARLKPDETYLRLRTLLTKKHKQLPKDSPGIILLDISDLAKLMVDRFTIERTLYGDLGVVFGDQAEGYPHDLRRKPNGYFMRTTRVSAVVIQTTEVTPDAVRIGREVFPTNNPNARVLTREELQLFGTIAEGLENLCAEELRG